MKRLCFQNHKNVVSAKIKTTRKKEAHYSQDQVVAKMQLAGININQQMVSKIEKDRRIVTDYELMTLCYILNINIQDLYNDFCEKYIKGRI